jgi:hypothetical protein
MLVYSDNHNVSFTAADKKKALNWTLQRTRNGKKYFAIRYKAKLCAEVRISRKQFIKKTSVLQRIKHADFSLQRPPG